MALCGEAVPASSSLALLPEAAFLRLVANLDLRSGSQLASTGVLIEASTTAALRALTEAVRGVSQDCAAVVADVEAQRVACVALQERERLAMARTLAALEPLRRHGLEGRPDVQEIFAELELRIPQHTAERDEAAEAERRARVEQAASSKVTLESLARGRISEGVLCSNHSTAPSACA